MKNRPHRVSEEGRIVSKEAVRRSWADEGKRKARVEKIRERVAEHWAKRKAGRARSVRGLVDPWEEELFGVKTS